MRRDKLLERLRARAANVDGGVIPETMNGAPCDVAAFRDPMRAVAALCGERHDMSPPTSPPPELLPPLP